MDDYFRVGIRPKLITLALQLRSQLSIIVNLAIEDYPNGFFCVRHRLMTAGQIDDGKPAESEANGAIEKVALIIRPAMDNRLGHAPNRFRLDRLFLGEVKLAANAAHWLKKLNR